jgi:O-antigen/teichoic acid export membrane protein
LRQLIDDPLSTIKKLAGQTAIYGVSSILGRFLNYLLVPLHTALFLKSQYGVITEMYSYVSFLIVLLMCGMETAYFRYTSKEGADKESVFTTAMYSLIATSVLFVVTVIGFSPSIAAFLKYPNNPEYVVCFALILGLDALTAIPLARLRSENNAKRFAFVNITSIAINILLNLFFLGYCMAQFNKGHSNVLIDLVYNPSIGVGYVFIANLLASVAKFLMLTPELLKARYRFNPMLLKSMLIYAFPLLIFGFAGIINETLDRVMLKWMLYDKIGGEATMSQLGIYGACYKLSIIITLFIQAFRYAAEPFFFAHEKEKNSLQTYSKIMTYFVIVCTTIFLGVLLYLDVVKHFIDKDYWEGLKVVPILMGANICLGIYYNQSIWYKLSGKTMWGAYLGVFGAAITIGLNFVWIPILGYVGSAWATLICYASMMLASYVMGQKYYPIPYNLKRVLTYIGVALGLYFVSATIPYPHPVVMYGVNSILFLSFLGIVYLLERRDLRAIIKGA